MKDRIKKLLDDCLYYGQRAVHVVRGKTLHEFVKNQDLQDIVERNLITVGEAFALIRGEDEEIFQKFEEAHRVIGFRNQIVHGYKTIDRQIVWHVVKEDLPNLLKKVKNNL